MNNHCVWTMIRFSTSLVIVVIQGCKLLSLLDIGSEYIISIALLLISTILPFARQLSLYFQHSVEMEKHLASASAYLTATSSQASTGLLVSTTELAVYVAFHAAACLLVGQQVSNMLLSFVLYGDMNVNAHDERVMWWQDVAVTLSIWLGFVSCLLFIFHRTAKYLRR